MLPMARENGDGSPRCSGAIERFIGVLIEHCGNFPIWLSPVQAIIVTVTDNQIPYAQEVYDTLRLE
jgi:threonyl-tRNA synthetase